MSTAPVLTRPIFNAHLVGGWKVADQTMAFRFTRPPHWLLKAGQFHYIAGPAEMVKSIREILNAAGIDDDDIRTEEFAGY